MPAKADQTVTFAPPPKGGGSAAAALFDDEPQPVAVDQAAGTFAGPPLGRYEEQRVLGKGGMGTVLLVADRTIKRNVALKVLNDGANDEDALSRFAREARIQGQLEHPAIVPVYDVGTGADGKAYFTMKRVRGQSLADVLDQIAQGKPAGFSRRKLLSAFSQLCAAAHYAHERGVVHRDIKPTNVMLGSYGEVYLLDWGVAKVAGEPQARQRSDQQIDAATGVQTGFGTVMGTLTTMAPEQAVGAEVDARTDVYALGAVLFQILTGHPLHPAGAFDEVIDAIVTGVEARPSVRFPEADVPPELEELCVKATRLQPGDRLPSAMALRDAIEAYLDGDRDVELRQALARRHAEAAREAAREALDPQASAGNEEAARKRALLEVGRALALDPRDKEVLATLVRLLTSPPKVMPREIAVAHASDLRRNIRRGGIAAAVVYGYISINAFSTLYLGVRDLRTFVTAHVLWALAFLASLVSIFRPSYPALLTTFALGVSTSAFITGVYGPYILVSTLITMHAVLFALIRDWAPRIGVIVFSCLAWTLSVFGEAAGIFPKTVSLVDGDMRIHSQVIVFDPKVTPFYLWASVIAAIVAPALVVGALRTAYHRTEIAMRLQSWQLRRLVEGADGDDEK